MTTTSTQALRLGLTHSNDVAEAMRLVERLGNQVSGVASKLSFPGPWVLAQQEGAAPVAAWAVLHCSDPSVLDQIALTDNLRLTVRAALLYNKHLQESTANALREETIGGAPYSAAEARKKLISEARRLMNLSKPKFTVLKEIREVLTQLIEIGETHYVDEFVKSTARQGLTWFVEKRLLAFYYPDHEALYGDADLFVHATSSPKEAFGYVAKGAQGHVAQNLVLYLSTAATAPLQMLDDDILAVALKGYRSPSVGFHENHLPLEQWLNPEGVELVRNTPQWGGLIGLSNVSDAGLEFLATTTFADCPGRLAGMIQGEHDYPRVEKLLSLIPEGVKLECEEMLLGHYVRAAILDGSEARFEQLISHFAWSDVLRALTTPFSCYLGTEYTEVFIPESWTDRLLELLLRSESGVVGEDEWMTTEISEAVMKNLEKLPESIQRALVYNIPGVAARIKVDDELGQGYPGQVIYDSLRGSGVTIEHAITMLYEQPQASLKDVAETCKAMTSK
jgi:hypothetical protein